LISAVSETADDAVGRNRRPARRGGKSAAMIEGEPDQVRTCGEHQ
jgi:hypothetical protein